MQDLHNIATAANYQTQRQDQQSYLPVNEPFEVLPRPVELSQEQALDLVSDKIIALQEQIKLAESLEQEQDRNQLLSHVKNLTDELYALIDKAVSFKSVFPHNDRNIRKLLEKRAQLIGLFLCLNFTGDLGAAL
ncbi:MAG: hypothetical protein K6F05_07180 [Succinivibrio sp.]|nr:hypothetical protein [Succinivibrio sp.]